MDAGTFGTMGVGLGFAIAAALFVADEAKRSGKPPRKVVSIIKNSLSKEGQFFKKI